MGKGVIKYSRSDDGVITHQNRRDLTPAARSPTHRAVTPPANDNALKYVTALATASLAVTYLCLLRN